MRKIKIDKKYMKIALYSFFVLASCILLSRFLDNIDTIFKSIGFFLSKIKDILLTFIYGFCIAYFFTPLVNFLEKFIGAYYENLRNNPKILRNITIFITYALFIGCFIWLMVFMLPTIAKSFTVLVNAIPENMDSLVAKIPDYLSILGPVTKETVINTVMKFIVPLQEKIADLPVLLENYLKGGNNMSLFINSTVNVVSTVVRFLIGIVISFYMLSTKESLVSGVKKFCLTVLKEQTAENFIQNMQRVNIIFQSFVLGKLLDAIVLGILCFIGLSILRIPYALVISVVIGITNMIPYVGPLIGTIPSIFIVLLVDPMKAVWLFIYIIIIQQIDNYIICPRLLGDPTGLTPLQVLFALTIGAYFGGALGMFISVPVVASIKLFVSEAINRRYRVKYPHGTPDIPDDTDVPWDESSPGGEIDH